MISLSFVQVARKKKADGTVPVWLRITANRKSRFKATGVSVKPEQWNPERGRVRKNHPASDALNSLLETCYVKALNTLSTLEKEDRASLDTVAVGLKRENETVYLADYADKVIDGLFEAKRYHPAKKTRVAVNKLSEFRKGKPIPLADITAELLEKFTTWLRTEKGNGPNTIAKDVEGIKRILKHAAKEHLIKAVPEGIDSKRVKTTKEKLSPAQIGQIEALELEKGSDLWHVRNWFLFSYYYAGIRFGDLCTLRWGDIKNGRLVYEMRKTGKVYPAPFGLPEAMKRILEHYRKAGQTPHDFILPILPEGRDYTDTNFLRKQIESQNAMANRHLKALASLAGIESNVSMHVARHSAAYRMLLDGVGIYEISKALAHENVSITETYLRGIDDTLIVQAMERVFSSKNRLSTNGQLSVDQRAAI